MASNLSFFTFNTKNNTNILHINIYGCQPVEYYIILSTKNNNLNAGISSRLHKRKTGREGGREALSLSTVESIVLLTLWFIILSCLGSCSNGPLTICCLTGLLFTQSACTYQKFRSSPAWLVLTCVPRLSADSAACVQARNRRCSKIKQTNILLIMQSVLQYINSIWINYC